MKSRVLVIKTNLLPWYNELDDYLETEHPSFPQSVRERMADFGDYTIISISRYETRLREPSRNKS
ncbi:hypothetical protein LOZ80_09610 [Paenibacillus sp. HWE-109]|uniref:hypothetical protein n=1 Tax=Paenibacillus sp. HWE-109 TaxID=1306526 RepID=UPI001EDED851|nr:hypothetical protein [Paenibacillus sp. HWE-109]UKS29163.1 hypothetical protein LOZ80_09610 [Paenibacillus sp. HWE-109]